MRYLSKLLAFWFPKRALVAITERYELVPALRPGEVAIPMCEYEFRAHELDACRTKAEMYELLSAEADIPSDWRDCEIVFVSHRWGGNDSYFSLKWSAKKGRWESVWPHLGESKVYWFLRYKDRRDRLSSNYDAHFHRWFATIDVFQENENSLSADEFERRAIAAGMTMEYMSFYHIRDFCNAPAEVQQYCLAIGGQYWGGAGELPFIHHNGERWIRSTLLPSRMVPRVLFGKKVRVVVPRSTA